MSTTGDYRGNDTDDKREGSVIMLINETMITDSWHSYPKIYNLGHVAIKDLFAAPVLIEEKVDGSQFSFGRFNGELRCRSKGAILNVDAPEKMFAKGVETARSLPLHDGWTYRAEYLQKPKHNSLAYDRTPDKYLALFDVNTAQEEYLSYEDKAQEAERIGLEVVPTNGSGIITDVEALRSILETTSFLGGQKIEGIVIKNYASFGQDGKVLMGKFVSEAFKEVHGRDWKQRHPNRADVIEKLTAQYCSKARWNKAVQHLREAGNLEGSPRDIGALLKEVNQDVLAECKDEIVAALFKWAWPQIARGLTRGLPEWYKQELLEKQFVRGDT